jgi:hypothetical protein
MEPLPQPDFQLLTQCLTAAIGQISLVPNIPTLSDGQTIAQQLRQITQSLDRQGEQMTRLGEQITRQGEQITTILNTTTTLQAEIGTINLRLDAR